MTRTSNFAFNITDFNKIPWTADEHENWYLVDAIFARFVAISNIKGTWKNATSVITGDKYVDEDNGAIYSVAVDHITSSTGTFDDDRLANPTYWVLFSEVELSKSWATYMDALVNDDDYSSKNWAIGTKTQNPIGSAKNWATLTEDVQVATGLYSALHYAAKASASKIAAATSEANADDDATQTAADRVQTGLDAVATAEDRVQTALDVIATAADVVSADAAKTAAQVAQAAAEAAAGDGPYTVVTTVSSADSPITLTQADSRTYYVIDMSTGNVTFNLPAIGTNDGMVFGFERVGAANTCSIVRNGTDLINDVASNYTLSLNTEVIRFMSDDKSPTDNWIATLQSQSLADEQTLTKVGSTFSIKDKGVDPTKAVPKLNEQTGTTYTLALADNLKTVFLSNASAIALTIPTNASIAFVADETRIDILNEGAGEVTVSGDTGVTVNGVSAGSFTLAQYAGASLYKRGTNTWIVPNQTVA